MSLYKRVPDGVFDYLEMETKLKRQIESDVIQTFFAWGYQMIETPEVEYHDVFARGDVSTSSKDKSFRFLDNMGRLLALRPDLTTQIARVVATKMNNRALPIKLCYSGNTFSLMRSSRDRSMQHYQAGLELIGDNSIYADAEVIALGITALKNTGLDNFKIDIGQVDYFNGLLEELGLDQQESEAVRDMVEEKNLVGVELFLKDKNKSVDDINKIIQITKLFGDRSILDNAMQLTNNPKCIAAIDRLKKIYDILCSYNMGEYLSFDIGIVQNNYYYSGIVFRGITSEIGAPILTGGRYDNLLEKYDYGMPAIGFAIDIRMLMIILAKKNNEMNDNGIYVIFDGISCKKAFEYAQAKRSQGEIVNLIYSEDKDSFLKQANIQNIKVYCIYNNNIQENRKHE